MPFSPRRISACTCRFVLAMVIVTLVDRHRRAILIGAPTLRLRGDYLAIVTLGFGEITYICLVNLDRPINITGGPSGIISIDPPSFFGYVIERNIEYYYLFLVTLGAVVLASRAAARFQGRLGVAGDPRGRARRRGDGHQHDRGEAAGLRDRRLRSRASPAACSPPGSARCSPTISCSTNRSTSWPW